MPLRCVKLQEVNRRRENRRPGASQPDWRVATIFTNVPVLFYHRAMQMFVEFGARRDLEQMMDLLKPLLADVEFHKRLDPISQLIRSLLGSRTKDEVSWRAFQKLTHEFPTFADLMKQSPTALNMVIADVTHSEKKARHIIQALRAIAARCPRL